ncbi:ADP-ribosylation factor family-domain-containing protein [Infundibulicybe gibba]|nr:ADP-ribosylation factor family-domain-containing protein [Infundibulicybe gibba]
MAVLQRLIDRLFPKSNGPTITILGLDCTGKTTLIYLLKLGEIVQTIPSIGFNVETFTAPTVDGKGLVLTAWDVGLGCADIRRMFGLVSSYTENADALIWMVDSADHERLQESVEALSLVFHDRIAKDTKRASKIYPVLILANKQDLPGAMSLDEIRIAFSKAIPGGISSVYPTSLMKSIPESGLPQAFDWLKLVLQLTPRETAKVLEQKTPDPRSSNTLTEKLESWLTRAGGDSPPAEFLSQFPYIALTTYGRQEGKDMIFDGIERYIRQSSQTTGRTFHFTMTYFWIQIVHFGSKDFERFLLLNPHVADGNLWADYYSKDVMMNPKAKSEMVLPDRKPLPNLVVRDAIPSKFGVKQ